MLDIVAYADLEANDTSALKVLREALLHKGIVGVRGVPAFVDTLQAYIKAVRAFALLPETIKQQYAPERDAGKTEGYELGAEWFKNSQGEWQIDDKKASYYAFMPDTAENVWPREMDLQTPYLALAAVIFSAGKVVLNAIDINAATGVPHEQLIGYGRMLHYHKESDVTNANPEWCGAHFDHGVFTGLAPAFYFRDGVAVTEPEEAGLFVRPPGSEQFEKIRLTDPSVLLFQVGEFGQLATNDSIQATRHKVMKAEGGIERFTFALFYNTERALTIATKSRLTQDARFAQHGLNANKLSYGEWSDASFDYYRAKQQKSEQDG
jgi:isopenicillin N synthase-like dioxygenase